MLLLIQSDHTNTKSAGSSMLSRGNGIQGHLSKSQCLSVERTPYTWEQTQIDIVKKVHHSMMMLCRQQLCESKIIVQ